MVLMIETTRDPDGHLFLYQERCCFCRVRTPYWTALKDRKPGEQVACCLVCAKIHSPSSVPSKRKWCDSERALRAK